MNLPESMNIDDERARREFLKGYRLQREEEYEEAIEAYEKSLNFQETAEAHTFLGWALSHLDRLDEAILECQRAIEVDPDFGNPYNDIGVYRLKQGRMNQAMEWFRKALDAPRYESYCFPHHNLGRIYRLRGKFDRAAHHFRQALEEKPGFEKAKKSLHQVQHRMN